MEDKSGFARSLEYSLSLPMAHTVGAETFTKNKDQAKSDSTQVH